MKTIPAPADMIYSFNKEMADRRGVLKKILMVISGGLGDVVCAGPSVRYAAEKFEDSEISLLTDYPQLFSHIENIKIVKAADHNDYFVHHSMTPASHLSWEFYSPMQMHCVDYASMSFFKMQLPNRYRHIELPDFEPVNEDVKKVLSNPSEYLIVHAGRGYQSKTFPVAWWDEALDSVKSLKIVLIGKTVERDLNAIPYPGGYVETTYQPEIDLRDKIPLEDLVALLKGCKYLLSNDSSPIHIAAAGGAEIGVLASLKHFDYLKHTKNTVQLNLTHAEDHMSFQQNQIGKVELYEMDPDFFNKILPFPFMIGAHYDSRKI